MSIVDLTTSDEIRIECYNQNRMLQDVTFEACHFGRRVK